MKAVVMAGGEGSRLRPLTCTRPKPMIRIMGRPVIGYIFDLLIKNGYDEIAVASGYRSEDIENYIEEIENEKVNIYCIEEEHVLGTAGSVRNAAKNWDEPFLVISGDCISDIELSKVMLYHKSIRADVTIVCSTVEDPGEYGTVNLTRSGEVDSFCEKPDWSHASSDLANTGIYIINPSVLDMIPADEPYDFANDLFPEMMNKNMRLYGYQTESYWCDIGDIKSFRMCYRDILSHKVNIEFPSSRNGIFSKEADLNGEYDIIPPVYIGKNVRIGKNCVIGPYTSLENGVTVGDNTRIKRSVILKDTRIEGNCDLIGSVVGEKCLFKRNTACLEGSCIGDACQVESGCVISNNVLVWPEKFISYRSVLTDNLRDGKNEYELIFDNGISGTTFSEMSCERCCKLGSAIGSSECGKKIGIGYDGNTVSKALAMALMSGLISVGSEISDFGECFESQMGYFVSFCSLDSGVYITADDKKTRIAIFGEYGLPLRRKYERDIVNRYKRSDFSRFTGIGCNDVNDMSGISEIYDGHLLNFCSEYVCGSIPVIKSKNPMIKTVVDKCCYLLGCHMGDKEEFIVDIDGKKVSAKDENGTVVTHEKLLALCAVDALSRKMNICIPFDAPAFIETVAEEHGASVFRAGKSPINSFSKEAATSARKNLWAFDGVSLVFKVIGIMKQKEKTLAGLVKELPDFNIASKTVAVSINPSKLASVFSIRVGNDSQGLRKSVDKGFVTVVSTGMGRLVKIIAEADTMEAAREICIDAEKKINSDIDNNT